MFVIGFSGKAMQGKDTCASIVREIAAEEGYNVGTWAYAHPLKAAVYGAGKGEYSFEEVWHDKPPAVRKHLQIMGTEKGRNVYGLGYWTLQTEAYLKLFSQNLPFMQGVTLTDVRFPNEVDLVRAGGVDVNSQWDRHLKQCLQKAGLIQFLDKDPVEDAEFEQLRQVEVLAVDSFHQWKAYQMIHGNGLALYIQSDRPTLTGEAAQHLSETALDDMDKTAGFDGIITNNLDTTLDDLRVQLKPFTIALLNQQD